MTTKPEICGLVDGDCPYLQQLQELLQDPNFQGINLQDLTQQDSTECSADCPDKQRLCQSLEELIKHFGLLPLLDVEVPINVLPLPSKVNLIPVKVSDGDCKDITGDPKEIPLKKTKSRELRAGRLFLGCECDKRYGLQDSCPRTECQGSAACQTNPPSCGPSQYCSAKHLIKKMKPNWRAIMFPNEAQKFCSRL